MNGASVRCSYLFHIFAAEILTVFTCFQNFFRLVDELLCELVAEMGITREQFKAACESSAGNATHTRIVQ